MPHVSPSTADKSFDVFGIDVKLADFEGTVAVRLGDRTETHSAGEVYYVPPGHVPIEHAGARVVECSPTEQLGEAVDVLMANVERGRSPQWLSSGG